MRAFAAALLLLTAVTAGASCVPHTVLKIVTAADVPGAAADDFTAQPRTLYRLGERFGRLEEALNRADNVHLLIVVNEPDLWMGNLTDGTGRHAVDAGPSLVFHAEVLDMVESKFWRQLEFGCEEPFMKAAGAQLEQTTSGAKKYTHSAEGTTVVLWVKDGKPQRIEVQGAQQHFALRYLTYEVVTNPPADLFTRPENIRFVEVKPEQ